MPERPEPHQHDRHHNGYPPPGPGDLRPEQVDEALAALPGWDRAGVVLVRKVPVPRDSRKALEEGVRNVVEDQSRLDLEVVDDDGLTIILGDGPSALRPTDLETAARIDTVLSGSGTDRGAS